jgi:2-haloacid dehalogenase
MKTRDPTVPRFDSRNKFVVFDFGGVLIDWNPRHLYRKLLSDEAAIERFLDTICTREWNERQDDG